MSFSVSVAILHALAKTQHGFSQPMLEALGITEWPTEPGATVEWRVAADAIERVMALAPPDLALRVGAEMSARALSIVGLVMMSAPNVRALIEAGTRFSSLLLSGMKIDLLEIDDEARLCFELPPSSPVVERAVTEFTLSFVLHIANEVHQQHGHVQRIQVRYPAPAHAEAYQRILKCDVTFGAETSSWSIPRADLDVALPGGDPAMFEMLCQRAAQVLAYREKTVPLAVRVKDLLRAADLDGSDMASVANKLKMSVTVLQRKLKEEGTSFSDLIDDIRREIALEGVLRDDITLKELSERLGFSETSAFHRAFRRWTGETTKAYRTRHGGKP